MAGVVSGRMNINPKYMIYHDLIGFYAYAKSISKLKEKNFTEIGEVIDESKNILITKNNEQIKKYIKKNYIFRFKISNGTNFILEVIGSKIVGRPENRLRNLRKKWRRKKK